MAKTKVATTKVAATRGDQKKPKSSAKPRKTTSPAGRPAAAKSPSAGKAPGGGRSAVTAKAPAAAKKPAPAAVLSIAEAPATQAPSKFRREYKRWKDTLISLRHRLRQEGSHLEEEGLKALEQEVSVDHMADYGSDSYEQDTTLALIENKSDALRDVDEAIRRIEVRTYGLCEECEQLIPHGRLEILPHARYCVTCQAKREDVIPA